ncbi:MAG: SynChlorMet cassette radical SAM/SPASM protein ScmF [Dissulfurispiraceae bacterium]|jgi:SynChlorMet cassette radical SAM/SPASM protein ScmF
MNDNNKNAKSSEDYPLHQIYFYLTEGCNLCCRHCWISPKFQSEGRTYPSLDFDLFRSIIVQGKALGLTGVKLTGGEPLLHPDIHRIIDYIRGEELRLTIETNGTLCTPGLAGEIKKCKDPHVSVSLDGANAETHEYIRGVGGCFEAALQGLRNLAEEGLKPQVIMSIMNRNKDQIEEVVRLAESLGAGSVKFNIVQPMERGVKLHESGDTLCMEELIELGRRVEMELSKKSPLRLFHSHPYAFRPLSHLLGGEGGNCGVCGIFGIIGVLSDGSYALCGIGESVKELTFGHSRKDSLADIWKNTEVLKQIREGLPEKLEGICGDCLMEKACMGFCIAQNYYRTKNFWAPFWYCEEARKKGLFPESRLRGIARVC